MLRNHTLAALSHSDRDALVPHLSKRRVERADVLTEQGGQVRHIYFPTTAFLVNKVTFEDGRSAQTFVMGLEGVSGLAAFLAGEPCAWSVEVLSGGEVFGVPESILRHQMDVSPRLRHQLLHRAYDYQAQAAFAVGCAALHSVASRLAGCLLLTSDRLGAGELRLTQEELAELLGVQRTTINAAALTLKAANAIDYSRGVVRVLDRHELTQHACECYERNRALQSWLPSVEADRALL